MKLPDFKKALEGLMNGTDFSLFHANKFTEIVKDIANAIISIVTKG